MPEFPDLPDVKDIAAQRESQDRYGRAIAVATVLTTLAAALVAFLQATALRIDDEAAVRAERLAAQSLGLRVRSQEAAQLQLERFSLGQQWQRRAALARQGRFFGGGEEGELRREEKEANRIAKKIRETSREFAKAQGLAPITEKGRDGPERDNIFPDRYLARTRSEAYRLSALRDGANEEGDRAEQQFTAYAVALTMFAVAVFLFGYSLTPQGSRQRKLYSGVATAFVVVAGTWAAITAIDQPNRPPDEAAAAFADGRVALETNDYDEAIRSFTKAIELRPNFTQAYIFRSQAVSSKGSPQFATNPSITSEDALIKTIEDNKKARELGSKDPQMLTSLGFDLYRLGLERDDDDLLEESVKLTREARRAYRSNPIPDYNLGVALLALGRKNEALQAYEGAIRRTIYVDVRRRNKRDDIIAEESFVAGALTDLEILKRYRGKRYARVIAEVKRRIVAPISALTAPPGDEGTAAPQSRRAAQNKGAFGKVELELTPALAEVRWLSPFDRTSFDPAKDRLNIQWYRLDPKGLGWSVLEQISGNVLEDGVLANTDRQYFVRQYFTQLTRPTMCLPDGTYRAEVYMNGRPVASAQKRVRFGNLKAAVARDVSVAFCYPPSWKPAPENLPGLIYGYARPDGKQGAYVLSISSRVVGGKADEARSKEVLDAAMEGFAELFPARPRPAGDSPEATFMGLEGEFVRTYRYKGGYVLAGAGTTEDGEIVVGAVFGPPDFYQSDEVDRVFFSFSQL